MKGVVLVIEDDPTQLLKAKRIVQKHGHTILTATCGEESLSIVKTMEVDVILMDVFLPDFHGSGLCPRLLREAVGDGPAVIAVSVNNDAENISKCLISGAVDYVTKPLGEVDTGLRIENALLKRGINKANAASMDWEKRVETLSLYTAGVAHDMGTPLAALSTALHLLDEPELLGLHQRELIADMHAAEEMLRMVTRKVVDYSKDVSGVNLVPNMVPTDLREVIAKSQRVMKRYSQAREKVEQRYNVAQNIAPLVLIDCTWLWEIIINLLSNACKFCIQGSITLSLAVVERDQSVGKEEDGGNLLLEIADTGIGIPEEKMCTLFKPFVQLQTTAGGTGLGLSTVASQVTALKGTYGLKANHPKGTIFWVRLPYEVVMEEACRTEVEEISEEEEDALSVLLIEDTGSIRKLTRMLLEKKGFEVFEAEDGCKGLQKMKERQYSLVLCDYMMPVMDGITCVSLYRQWASEQKLPYVQLICGLSAQAATITRECLAAGMNVMLSKPINNRELMSVIKQKRIEEAQAPLTDLSA